MDKGRYTKWVVELATQEYQGNIRVAAANINSQNKLEGA